MNEELKVQITGEIKDLEAKLGQARKELGKFEGASNVASKKSAAGFSMLGDAAKSLGGIIAAAFSINALVSFGKSIVETTSEFQKFEAVLSNTLGSSSAAQTALIQIADFAAQTPFQIDELTGAFVKLANQGLRPTTTEMRKMGDLASSTGKSFDQLVEGILDAQTGEFERLKEFGIRAQSSGDKVIFTFKGIKTEVDKTADSIKNYITSLGDIKGVSGSMAKISETLDGKLSNLSDNFTQLQNNIGQLNSGALSGMVDLLQDALGYFSQLTSKQLMEQKLSIGVTIDGEKSKQIIDEYNNLLSKIGEAKDLPALSGLQDYIQTNLQFFKQAMVNEVDSQKRDVQFAYFNLFKEARNAASGQQKLILEDIKKANAKIAEEAKKVNAENKFKQTIKFKLDVAANPEEILPDFEEAAIEINSFVAQTNLLKTGLDGIAIIGQEATKTITDISNVDATVTNTQIQTTVELLRQEVEQMNLLSMSADMLASGFGNAFASAIIDGENFGKSMTKVLEDFGRMILAQIGRLLALKAAIRILSGIASFGITEGVSAAGLGMLGKLTSLNIGSESVSNGVNSIVTNNTTNSGSVSFEIRGDKLFGVLQNYNQRLVNLT